MSEFQQQLSAAGELAGELHAQLQGEIDEDQFPRRLDELVSRCTTLAERAADRELDEATLEELSALHEKIDELTELAGLRRKRLATRLRHLEKSERTLDSYGGGEEPARSGGLDRTG